MVDGIQMALMLAGSSRLREADADVVQGWDR